MKNRIERVRNIGEDTRHRVLSELTVDLHFIVLYHFPSLISGYTRVSSSIVLLCIEDLQCPTSWKSQNIKESLKSQWQQSTLKF